MAWRGQLHDDNVATFTQLDARRGAARVLLAVLKRGEANVSEAMEIIGKEKVERETLREIVEEMGLWLRDLCWLAGGGSAEEIANPDLLHELKADLVKYEGRDLVEAWHTVTEALQKIDANANQRLVLDELTIKLAKC